MSVRHPIIIIFILSMIIIFSGCSSIITKEPWEKNPTITKYDSKLFKVYDKPIVDDEDKEWDVRYYFGFNYYTNDDSLRCYDGLSTPYETRLDRIEFRIHKKDGTKNTYKVKPQFQDRDETSHTSFYKRSTVVKKNFLEYYKYKLGMNFIKDIGNAATIEFLLFDGRDINQKVQLDEDTLEDFKEIYKVFKKDNLLK